MPASVEPEPASGACVLASSPGVVPASSIAERTLLNRAVDEAVDSAVAYFQRLTDPTADAPRVAFGGLVVEFFERPDPARARCLPEQRLRAGLH